MGFRHLPGRAATEHGHSRNVWKRQNQPGVSRPRTACQEKPERAAEEAVRLAEQKVAVTLDSIRDNATPVIRDAVNRLEIQLVQERTANRTLARSLRAQLVVADSTARLWQTRYAAAERVAATQDQVIQDYEARLRVALQRNDTRWAGRVVGALKYVGVFAAGYALASR